MGVALDQWRAVVGRWASGRGPVKHVTQATWRLPLHWLAVLTALLVIGGVELNPGPGHQTQQEIKDELKKTKNENRSLEKQLKEERRRAEELETQFQQILRENQKMTTEKLVLEKKIQNCERLLAQEQSQRAALNEQIPLKTTSTHSNKSVTVGCTPAILSRETSESASSSAPPMYQKTSTSADMDGQKFEVKLTALMYLRGVNFTQHFYLATNFQAADKFDDVVFKYTTDVTSGWKTILIQLKHKTDNKFKIKREQLVSMSPKSIFGLIKYCHSYLTVKDIYQCNSDLQFLGDFNDFEFVLYTNAGVDGTSDVSQSSECLISTGEQGGEFSLTAEKDSDIFQVLKDMTALKELLTEILNSQTDSGGDDWRTKLQAFKLARSKINAELFSTFNSLKETENIDDISKAVQDFQLVHDFSSYEEFFQRFQLFSQQAHQKDLDSLIEAEIQTALGVTDQSERSRIASLVSNSVESWWAQKDKDIQFLNEKSCFWKDVVKDRIIQLSLSTAEKFEVSGLMFQQSALSSLRQVLPKRGILNVISFGTSSALSCQKIRQVLSSDDKQAIFNSIDSLLDRQEEVLHLWQNRFCRTLVVDCESDLNNVENLCVKLITIIGKSTVNLRVVLVSCNDTSLSDLFKTDKLNYDEVRDDCRWSDLTEDSLTVLLRRTVWFQGVQVPLSLLIDQDERLSKQLKGDTLCSLLSEEMELGLELPPPIEYYIPRKLVRSGVTTDVESVDDILEKVVLIGAEPGMGKSTLLTQLAYSAKQDDKSSWVIRINLNDCSEYLKSLDSNAEGSTQPFEFLSKFGLNVNATSRFEESYLEHCLRTSGNINIFLDGLDEIAPYYEAKISLLIKILMQSKFKTIWITSRLAPCENLEKCLNIIAFNLKTFTKQDQSIFLQKFWQQKFCDISTKQLTAFTDRVLELASNAFRGEDLVISIPQQTRMLGEYFEDQLNLFSDEREIKLSEKLNLMNLYQHFVNKKLEVYAKEKRKEDLTNAFTLGANESLNISFYQNHKLAALFLLFSTDELHELNISPSQNEEFFNRIKDGREKRGIIDKIIEGKPHFIHRTFAEYFAAIWFFENFSTFRQFMLDHFFRPEFEVIKEMFDCLLSSDSPLQSAVISREVEVVKQLLASGASVDEPDKGGRTALHLSGIYGHTHSTYKQITQVLLDNGATVDTRDKVLNFRPLQYADATDSWTVAGLLLQKGGDVADFTRTESSLAVEVYTELLDFITDKVQGYTQLLHSAARYGELRVLKFLIHEVGADVNLTQEGQVSPLHRAAKGGHVTALRYLVEKGASLSSPDSSKRLPLHYAAQHGQLEAIKYLVEQGSDVNAYDKDGWSPVLLVTQLGFQEAMDYLVSKNATIQSRHTKSFTPKQLGVALLWSVYNDNLHLSKALLSQRASVNHVDDKGISPLHWAAFNNFFEMVKILIKKGADVNVSDNKYMTPLCQMFCANRIIQQSVKFENESLKILQHLIQHGASVNPLGISSPSGVFMWKRGLCPQQLKVNSYMTQHLASLNQQLLGAAESRVVLDVKKYIKQGASIFIALNALPQLSRLKVIEFLIDAVPECVDGTYHYGCTIMHDATSFGLTDVVQLCINKGLYINKQDMKGNSPLMLAAEQAPGTYIEKSDIIQCLLDAGADVELCNNEGTRPLILSAYCGYLNGVQMFIRAGCNVNLTRNVDGMTPLMVAAANGHVEVVRALLEAGADVNATCAYDQTALHYGLVHNAGLPTLEILSSREDFLVDRVHKCEQTYLMCACETSSLEVIQFLMQKGADIRKRDSVGRTCLHFAAIGGQIEAVKFLVSQGIPVNLTNNKNETAADVARTSGHTLVAQYLETK